MTKFRSDRPITVFPFEGPPLRVANELETDDKREVEVLRGAPDVSEVKAEPTKRQEGKHGARKI